MFRITTSLAVLILTSCLFGQNLQKADDLNDRGLKLYESGDYDAAIEAFNKAIDLTSRLTKPVSAKTNLFPPSSSDEASLADSIRVVDPRTAAALVNRGNVYFAKSDLDRAMQDYDAAIRIYPSFSPAFVARASVWIIKREHQRALDDQTRAIKIDPRNVLGYVSRALTRLDMGDRKAALDDVNTALQIDPDNTEALFRRGDIYRTTDDFARALSDYERAIRIGRYR